MRQKRITAVLLLLILSVTLCGCGLSKRSLKIGVVISDDLNDTYRQSCIDGVERMRADMKLKGEQISVIESAGADDCYDVLTELVEGGCNIILGFGTDIEDGLVQAATEQPDVQFFMAYGMQATNGLSNYHCFAPPDCQSRYIAGVAAGLKLNELIKYGEITKGEAFLGYAAEFPDAESVSAYTAFYLGARSVCEAAQMKVQYTYSDNNATAEKKAVMALIANGCRLISKQSELTGAAAICAENNTYFVSWLSDEKADAPDYYVGGAKIDISSCLTHIVDSILNKEIIPQQISIPPDDPGAYLSEINGNAFSDAKMLEEAQQKATEAAKKLIDKSLYVFNTSSWTVAGERVETTASEELYDTYFGIECISDGRFMENELTSSPKFEFRIDGITELNYSVDYFSENIGG